MLIIAFVTKAAIAAFVLFAHFNDEHYGKSL